MAKAPRQCTLLAGAPALLAQLSLAVLAFATLAYKRWVSASVVTYEDPQEPIDVFDCNRSNHCQVSSAVNAACPAVL